MTDTPEHLPSVGQGFLDDDWQVTCPCGWSLIGLASHTDAIEAANRHERHDHGGDDG
jgi:hypothetical protein